MVTRELVQTQPGLMRITFSLPASIWADEVKLAGDFDGSDAGSKPVPMRRDEDGWSITMMLECDRAYSYYYLVDHQRLADWNADGYIVGRDGSTRSVVIARSPRPSAT